MKFSHARSAPSGLYHLNCVVVFGCEQLILALLGITDKGLAMANKKFIVELSGEERARLTGLISKGKAPAKTILKARILLKADQGEAGEGWLDEEICEALDTNSAWSRACARSS